MLFCLVADAVGTVAGAFAAGRMSVRRPLLIATLCGAFVALPYFAMAWRLPLPSVVVTAFLSGVAVSLYAVLWATALQAGVEQSKLGRVAALDSLGSVALAPFGALLAAPLARVLGASDALLVLGGLAVVATAGALTVSSVRSAHGFTAPRTSEATT